MFIAAEDRCDVRILPTFVVECGIKYFRKICTILRKRSQADDDGYIIERFIMHRLSHSLQYLRKLVSWGHGQRSALVNCINNKLKIAKSVAELAFRVATGSWVIISCWHWKSSLFEHILLIKAFHGLMNEKFCVCLILNSRIKLADQSAIYAKAPSV